MHDERDVVGPLPPQRRLERTPLAGRHHHDPLVTNLPAVAVRAVQHVPAKSPGDAGDRRQLVGESGGDQHAAGVQRGTVRHRHSEDSVVHSLQANDPSGPHLDAVRGDLGAADRQQLGRRNPFPPEVAVHVLGGRVAGAAIVDDHDRAPSPPQHQRRGQPRRPASDDHHIDSSWCTSILCE